MTPMQDLPIENLRDLLKHLERTVKYRYMPFRAYYRLRCYRYLKFRAIEMQLLRFLADPQRISLDIGANVGLFTYFLARYSPAVHAFEPNPMPFNVLKSVVDRNVVLHQEAITDQSREVELIVPRRRKGWSSNGASLQYG